MDSEMLGESTLGSQGRDSMMDEDWAATEFDPQDEHANLGGNPADEDEQYDEQPSYDTGLVQAPLGMYVPASLHPAVQVRVPPEMMLPELE